MGNSIFRGYKIADSYRTAFQAHKTNYTKEEVIFEDSIVVGRS